MILAIGVDPQPSGTAICGILYNCHTREYVNTKIYFKKLKNTNGSVKRVVSAKYRYDIGFIVDNISTLIDDLFYTLVDDVHLTRISVMVEGQFKIAINLRLEAVITTLLYLKISQLSNTHLIDFNIVVKNGSFWQKKLKYYEENMGNYINDFTSKGNVSYYWNEITELGCDIYNDVAMINGKHTRKHDMVDAYCMARLCLLDIIFI